MTASEIIEELAKKREVETIVANVAHMDMDDDLRDLCQIIYLSLLTQDPARIVKMHDAGELNYFISKMVTNQYRTKNSPWHNAVRKFRQKGESIDGMTEYYEEEQ